MPQVPELSRQGSGRKGKEGEIGEKARKKPKKGSVSLFILLVGLLMTN